MTAGDGLGRDPVWVGDPDAADAAFVELAERAVETVLALDPVAATSLGDHRFDDRLPDLTDAGTASAVAVLEGLLADVDAVDDLALGHEHAVDLEILRTQLAAAVFRRATLRAPEWDPLRWNPGAAVHSLLARGTGPPGPRVDALAGRLAAVPGFLADARETLRAMPRVHVETAIGQLEGTERLFAGPVDALVAAAGRDVDAAGVAAVRDRACEAVREHVAWLADRRDEDLRDPRLGEERYAAALWHALDEPLSPQEVLHRAEADVDRITVRLQSLAAQWLGVPRAGQDEVRRALAECADDVPVDDGSILERCHEAYLDLREFTEEHDLVTVPDDPVEVVVMPEVRRGVAAAYCDAPGPLEDDGDALTTFIAVSPTPAGWSQEQVRSYYRDYHGHFLPVLMAHEGVPGHVLQLGRARRATTPTRVRRVWSSGVFVEGWAVHAEGLVEDAGYAGLGGERGRRGYALQRARMLLRTALNAVLDVRVHTRGMTHDDAVRMLVGSGVHAEGAAEAKWRRALLTHAQLTTYHVGVTEVARLEADLAAARPAWSPRQVRDAMLAHGSPGPRHLRALLDLPT